MEDERQAGEGQWGAVYATRVILKLEQTLIGSQSRSRRIGEIYHSNIENEPHRFIQDTSNICKCFYAFTGTRTLVSQELQALVSLTAELRRREALSL